MVEEREDPVVLVAYDPKWPAEFRAIADRLRAALGSAALRIDHVGSTAVPGLAAKPVLDIQLSVAALDPSDPYLPPLAREGWRLHPENPDRSKRFFREPAGQPRAHLHVRPAGSVDEQMTLLFRDYLRGSPTACEEYAREKRRLAALFRDQRARYVQGKAPTVWRLLADAHTWAQETGWLAGPSDG